MMANSGQWLDMLESDARALGVELGGGHLDMFARYMDELLRWSGRLNLTSLRQPSEIASKHFLDSLAAAPFLDLEDGLSLMDVGPGAGFPGIPLKIFMPGVQLALLEARKKKIQFLESTCQRLGLTGVRVVHGRAEDYGRHPGFRETFDRVTARAVAPLRVLAEYCLPFVRPGGAFVAYKGPAAFSELEEASRALGLLGAGDVRSVELQLPHGKRTLLVIPKAGSTPPAYPRKGGIPRKRPL